MQSRQLEQSLGHQLISGLREAKVIYPQIISQLDKFEDTVAGIMLQTHSMNSIGKRLQNHEINLSKADKEILEYSNKITAFKQQLQKLSDGHSELLPHITFADPFIKESKQTLLVAKARVVQNLLKEFSDDDTLYGVRHENTFPNLVQEMKKLLEQITNTLRNIETTSQLENAFIIDADKQQLTVHHHNLTQKLSDLQKLPADKKNQTTEENINKILTLLCLIKIYQEDTQSLPIESFVKKVQTPLSPTSAPSALSRQMLLSPKSTSKNEKTHSPSHVSELDLSLQLKVQENGITASSSPRKMAAPAPSLASSSQLPIDEKNLSSTIKTNLFQDALATKRQPAAPVAPPPSPAKEKKNNNVLF